MYSRAVKRKEVIILEVERLLVAITTALSFLRAPKQGFIDAGATKFGGIIKRCWWFTALTSVQLSSLLNRIPSDIIRFEGMCEIPFLRTAYLEVSTLLTLKR